MKQLKKGIYPLILLVFTISCSVNESKSEIKKSIPVEYANEKNVISTTDTVDTSSDDVIEFDYPNLPEGWTDLAKADTLLIMDIRYATENNFVDTVMYPCGRCALRTNVAKKLLDAQTELWEKHQLRFVLFDCYRPHPVQWALWHKVPNPQYVANPKKGSMHNRGMAVDIGLATADGTLLDMGTDFDFFGKEAYHDYKGHSDVIQSRRDLLKGILDKHGFRSTRTEWWHYSLRGQLAPIADYIWECEKVAK